MCEHLKKRNTLAEEKVVMGCTSGMFAPYTAQELEMEAAKVVPRLPVAELMNGGIIRLEGANGLFNPYSLLDPSWLKGKITPDEYVQAIQYINQCATHSHVGLSRIYTTTERPMRLQLLVNAGMNAVQELNQRHRAVRFTYQQTIEDIPINTSYQRNQYAQRSGQSVAHATKVMLYIALQ